VDGEADGARRPAARSGEAAEQLRVVVLDAEHALVERLLRRPHGSGGDAGQRPPQRPRAVEGHGGHCNEHDADGYAS
jgi:hypothetical protein